MTPLKILALSGSSRVGSFNRMALAHAARGAQEVGAEVTLLNLADFPLPLYQGDLEAAEGVPAKARELQEIFAGHQALLLASPEYNGLPSPLLKNTLDWASREAPEDPPVYGGKIAAILSASPGGFGGMRGLTHVRVLLGNLGMIVLPEQVAVSGAHTAFNEDGTMRDEAMRRRLESLGRLLAASGSRLSGLRAP